LILIIPSPPYFSPLAAAEELVDVEVGVDGDDLTPTRRG